MSASIIWTSRSTAESIQAAANAAQFWDGDFDSDFNEAKESKYSWRAHHTPICSDMLSAVEDVWLRLTGNPAVKFATCWDQQAQTYTVMFRSLRDASYPQTQELLEDAASSALYTWQDGSQIYKLCSGLVWIGDTLVIELQPKVRLMRHAEGEELMSRIQELLIRLSK